MHKYRTRKLGTVSENFCYLVCLLDRAGFNWRKNRKSNQIKELTPSTVEAQLLIKQLEKENAELKRANDILKDARGFFAQDRKK